MHFLKLRKFVEDNIDKLDWRGLSRNPNAIYLLEQNQDKIHWKIFITKSKCYSHPGPKSRKNRFARVMQQSKCNIPLRTKFG